MSDSFKQREKSIVDHMNKDHKDSLMAMAHYYLELPRPPVSAKMLNLSSTGFEVEYKIMNSVWSQNKPRISKILFLPPLKTAEEVRPRVVSMAEESEIKRNRKYPIIYSPPRDFILMFSALAVIALLRSDSLAQNMPSFLSSHWNEIRSHTGGKKTLDLLLGVLIKAHLVEAVGMAGWSFYKGASLGVAVKWTLTTFIVGFPSFFKFNQLNSLLPKVATRGKVE